MFIKRINRAWASVATQPHNIKIMVIVQDIEKKQQYITLKYINSRKVNRHESCTYFSSVFSLHQFSGETYFPNQKCYSDKYYQKRDLFANSSKLSVIVAIGKSEISLGKDSIQYFD